MKKKTIIILAGILIVLILAIVGWLLYYFPYNVPIRGKRMYEIAHSNAKVDRYYFCDYGFFPYLLPDNAKSVKFYGFSGMMQARAFFTLSFKTDDEYFKNEVGRYEVYNVYLFNEDSEDRWCMIEEDYTGEVKTCEELKKTYSASGYGMEISVPDIPKKEYPDTCIYVLNRYCYIAYSSASGRIVYHLDTEYLNGYGHDFDSEE